MRFFDFLFLLFLVFSTNYLKQPILDPIMAHNVLVTGGAGFIGSFVADELINRGHHVIIFDNLEDQVHKGSLPSYLNKKATFVKGDVRDQQAIAEVLSKADVVFHFAAAVGIGQSMYQIERFVHTNSLGTANMLDFLANNRHHVKKIIIASSNTLYGEGCYLNKIMIIFK